MIGARACAGTFSKKKKKEGGKRGTGESASRRGGGAVKGRKSTLGRAHQRKRREFSLREKKRGSTRFIDKGSFMLPKKALPPRGADCMWERYADRSATARREEKKKGMPKGKKKSRVVADHLGKEKERRCAATRKRKGGTAEAAYRRRTWGPHSRGQAFRRGGEKKKKKS